jgi:hypothetical protein
MPYREAEPDDPASLEMMRGRTIVINGLRDGMISSDLVPSILVSLMLSDIRARKLPLNQSIKAIDEYAAYLRAAISAHHMCEEFFGSERA